MMEREAALAGLGWVLFLGTVVILLGGCDEYESAVAAEKEYCVRVEMGVHSDYDNLCNEGGN